MMKVKPKKGNLESSEKVEVQEKKETEKIYMIFVYEKGSHNECALVEGVVVSHSAKQIRADWGDDESVEDLPTRLPAYEENELVLRDPSRMWGFDRDKLIEEWHDAWGFQYEQIEEQLKDADRFSDYDFDED